MKKKKCISLPKEYRSFLLKNNGGRSEPNIFITEDETFESDVQFFHGIIDGVYGLIHNLDLIKERRIENKISIGNDSFGNFILLDLGNEIVYFLDHETNEQYKIANSFEDFLKGLYNIGEEQSEFDLALASQNIEYFEAQLKELSSVDEIKNEFDQRVFTAACMRGKLKLIKYLVSKGASLKGGLLDTCKRGYLELANFLLEQGANIEEREHELNETTPLIAACYGGHLEVVKMLISKGADIHATDKNDYNALDKSLWSNNK